MSIPVVVIRPEPGNAETVAAAWALGLEAIALPLQQVEPVAWDAPKGTFDALLIGSANALRHAGEGLEQFRDLPVHAVGERTAEEARALGLAVASVGTGGLQAVVDALPGDGSFRLLRLAGEEHLPLEVPADVSIETRTVYRVRDLSPGRGQMDRIEEGACVLLHSASSTRHFLAICEALGIDRSKISIAAMGPRIDAAAGDGWAAIRAAEKPHDDALLALARDMCQ